MDPIARMVAAGAAGAAGGESTYVDDVFSTYLYKGNSSGTGSGDEQVITTGIDNTEKSLIWFKNRDGSSDHALFDTERTSPDYRWIRSNKSDAELQSAAVLKDRTTTGFTVVNATSGSGVATTNPSNSEKMIAWNFRAMPGFFDIVTWTGDGTTSRTIAHSLGSAPGMILVKRLNDSDDWQVYHRSLGATKCLQLNQDYAASTITNRWYDTEPTSTVFTVANTSTNANGKTYVAYLFAHDDQSFGTNGDEAIIKCGSFTTDSSGTFNVNLGFEPQWLMYKRTDSSADWAILDTMRDWTTRSLERAFPSSDQAPFSNIYEGYLQPYSQGFRSLSAYFSGFADYIYVAIRRPNKPPEDGTDVFAIDTSDATSPSPPQFTSGFVTDFIIRKTMDGANATIGSRMVGVNYMSPYSTSTESTANLLTWDFMDGWSNSSGVDTDLFCYMFKRAPGFFDVVAYTGTSANRTVNHNLGVAPELMIVKGRNFSDSWQVYNKVSGATKFNTLRQYGDQTGSERWNDTEPTSTVFTVGTDNGVNNSGYNYIAYLFASLSGISKVDSYTGTGNNIDVDCGFTAGARFVLIKRIDGGINTSADWYVWDTTRGIVSGNDPYFLLNEAVVQVTNTDYIDPLNAGFTVTSSAPAALNASGGTYLFLAIA